jgi:hypothetical protein
LRAGLFSPGYGELRTWSEWPALVFIIVVALALVAYFVSRPAPIGPVHHAEAIRAGNAFELRVSDREVRPVAAAGARVLLEGVRSDGEAIQYHWWDPATGVVEAEASRIGAPAVYSVAAVIGDLVVTREQYTSNGQSSVILHDLSLGSDTVLASDIVAGPAVDGDRILWVSRDGGLKLFQVDEKSTTSITVVGLKLIESVAISGNHIALCGMDFASRRVIAVEDLAGANEETIPVDTTTDAISLSGDERFLFWQQGGGTAAGLYVRDLEGRKTSRVLSSEPPAGTLGLSAVGEFVSWQPLPHPEKLTPGFYDATTRKLFLLDLAGADGRVSAVMGSWFVWGESGGETFNILCLAPAEPVKWVFWP